MYLTTKKIGRNNPKDAEIEADNAARQEWSQAADMALITGISEETILEISRCKFTIKSAGLSVTAVGFPNLFRRMVNKAKEFLQNLIREHEMLPKPKGRSRIGSVQP